MLFRPLLQSFQIASVSPARCECKEKVRGIEKKCRDQVWQESARRANQASGTLGGLRSGPGGIENSDFVAK